MNWTDADRKSLVAFLQSSAGHKLKNGVITHIINQSQKIVGEGAPVFDAGAVTGMKILWVFIETLTSAGVAPEADQDYE